jgi:serine/threonine protein kinase
MEVCCTRPHCQHPKNYFPDLDDIKTLKTVQQKYCTSCGMPLILRDHYLPIKLLARGGFGAAFLAIDRDTPTIKKCVVKQFQPSSNLTEEALKKAKILFEQEAKILEEIGLIFAQTKRWLEKFDLLIIPAVSFTIIFFIPFLRSNIAIEQVIMLAAIAALISITVTTLFRLIYKLMSSIL